MLRKIKLIAPISTTGGGLVGKNEIISFNQNLLLLLVRSRLAWLNPFWVESCWASFR